MTLEKPNTKVDLIKFQQNLNTKFQEISNQKISEIDSSKLGSKKK